VADERFRPGALDDMLARMRSVSQATILQPEFSQAEALISLRVAEQAAQRKSADNADSEIEAAESKLRTALATTPSASFLWWMLYSVKTARNGFDSLYMRSLEQSYATGPFEGWIALRRNRVALATLSTLDEKVQRAVIAEFAAMVDASYIEASIATIEGATSVQRDRLMASLTNVDIASRQALAKQLWRNGMKVDVPGVPPHDRSRP